MSPEDSSRVGAPVFEVRTPVQARLLSDAASRAFFLPFLARTRSVSEAAREVGCPLDAMHYRVKRFLAAGLLTVVTQRPRAGRPIKLYRSVGDAFHIPFALTPYAELEERIRSDVMAEEERVIATLARALRESGLEGRRLYRSDDGEAMYVTTGQGEGALDWRAVVRAWPEHQRVTDRYSSDFELTDGEARELLLALHEVHERFRMLDRSDGRARRTYHVQFAVVPWEP